MLQQIIIFIILIFSWLSSAAQQHQEEKNKLRSFFEEGKFDFHARSVFMSTINRNELTDFSTLGFGAGLGYVSPYYKNFRIGLSGFFIRQVYEHHLIDVSHSGMGSRYELTLYDMHDPNNKKDLDRLEEFYLEYSIKSLGLTLGRQKINSPLLNEQDNRMRPNLFSGLMANYERNGLRFDGGWLTSVSPRGTVNWYSVEESFGVYPFGRNVQGTSSGYKNNISSKGIGILGLQYNSFQKKHQIWNYYVENVFNLSFVQSDFQFPVGKQAFILGAQGFFQTPLNQGGNPDPLKTYIQTGSPSLGGGLSTGIRKSNHQLTLNYLGITKHGRFLFPREWGREIFYASLPRERYEGSGGVNVYTLKYEFSMPEKNIITLAGIGRANFPEVNHFELNKYGLPSYYHLVGRIDYNPKGFFEGVNLMFMAVNKIAQDPKELNNTDFQNKVDMWNFTVMVDYKF